MASILENLIEILDKENTEYKLLIELAERKTRTIVDGDLENLGKITDDEQVIVGRIQGMEEQRAKLLADIANVVNRDVETLKLSNLIQLLEKMPDQQKMLVRIHEELTETMDQLRLTNNKNQLLLTERLEMVDFNLNMIRALKSAPQTANYTKDAYNDGTALGILHGGFDAKQ